MARIEKYNRRADEIVKEGREKLCTKMRCKHHEGKRTLARCDKIWEINNKRWKILPPKRNVTAGK